MTGYCVHGEYFRFLMFRVIVPVQVRAACLKDNETGKLAEENAADTYQLDVNPA